MIPNDSFHSSLIESNLLNCPTCLRPYSGEAEFRPHILNCGHSTCGSCINVHSQCGVCNQDYGASSQRTCVNYNLRDVVEEMNKVAMEAKKFSVQCRKCSRWEDMDRCRICKTCAREPAEEIEEENNDYEKMPLFVFCPSCAIDDHMEKAHIVTKYQTFKNVMRMRAASDNAHKNVKSIVELCEGVWEESQTHVQEWSETVVKTLAIGNTDLSVRKCQQLAESCEDLGIGVYEAIDSDLLPALRRFTSLVKTATNSLNSNIADGVYLNAPAALPVLGNGKPKEDEQEASDTSVGESVDEVAKTKEIASSGQLPDTPSATGVLKSAAVAVAGIEDSIVVTPDANDDGIVGNGATVSDDVQKETCTKGVKTDAVVKDKNVSANKIKMPEGEVKDDDASNSGKGHFASYFGIAHQRLDDTGDPDCDVEQEENQTQTSATELDELLHGGGGYDSDADAGQLDELLHGGGGYDSDADAGQLDELLHGGGGYDSDADAGQLDELLHGGYDSDAEAAGQLDELLFGDGDDEVDEYENAAEAELEEMLHRSYEDENAAEAELEEMLHRSYEDDFAAEAELEEMQFAADEATEAMYEAFEEREEMDRSYEDDFAAAEAELEERDFAADEATEAMYAAFEEREEMLEEARIIAEIERGYNFGGMRLVVEEYDEANEPPPDQFFPDDD